VIADHVYHILVRLGKSMVTSLVFFQRIKWIVSREFGALFFSSLDRFEGRNRAGSGLCLILKTFSCLNLNKKICIGGKDHLEYGIVEF
jgi:hypothetical protein